MLNTFEYIQNLLNVLKKLITRPTSDPEHVRLMRQISRLALQAQFATRLF